jgi:PAS domain S-box-containing protein
MDDPKRLRDELERLRLVVADLEHKKRELEDRLEAASTMAEVPAAITSTPELEQTLGRLIKKVAMILQAEKAVIMIYDPESGDLVAQKPALGLNEAQLSAFRVRASEGVSGEVFRTREATVFNDAVRDDRTIKDLVALLHVRNGVTVPLVIRSRDEEQRIVDTRCIGVLHVFNKRFGQDFSAEDLRLLSMLADQAAAVIANARAYIKIAQEKEQLEATFQSIQSGVVVVGSDGKIRLVNTAAKQIFGIPSDDGVGKPFTDVLQHEPFVRLLERSMHEEQELQEEISVSSAGDRIFQAQTSLMKTDEDRTNVVAILNDITEIRNVERMKTSFVSTVSHELRTPLTSIKGFISTLLQDTEGYYDNETRLEFYNIIDQECDRLHRLISDLLNISRIEAGRALEMNWKTVNIAAVARRVAAAQQSYTNKHRVVVSIPDDFPTIVADEDKVNQIIDNLVGNAIKYSPDGGEVEVSGTDEGDTIRVCVSDEGIGIPEAHREKVFERFHRVDTSDTREAQGTGIGLYLVRHLVEMHGGQIWLERSVLGEGSVFCFRLPKEPSQAASGRG